MRGDLTSEQSQVCKDHVVSGVVVPRAWANRITHSTSKLDSGLIFLHAEEVN